jgi:hypothetical protein
MHGIRPSASSNAESEGIALNPQYHLRCIDFEVAAGTIAP